MQKFNFGDHVQIDVNDSLFTNNKKAIVVASYQEQYGGTDVNNYTVLTEEGVAVSWTHSSNMTLITERDFETLKKYYGDKKYSAGHGIDICGFSIKHNLL